MFYINSQQWGNDILLIENKNGERVFKKISNYKPYLFVPSQKQEQTEYTSVFGNKVERIEFGSIKEAKDFVKQYETVSNYPIYGLQNYNYTFINDRYPGEVKYDSTKVNVVIIDIETDSEGAFPNLKTADKAVISISLRKIGATLVFGMVDFITTDETVTYIKCEDEKELLLKFLHAWNDSGWFPDIISGWNCSGFDLPYLYKRITNVLGESFAKMLSPWKIVKEKTLTYQTGEEEVVYDFLGLSVLDYIQVYKKFSYTPQESYALDFVAEQELGEKKVDYKSLGYHSLDDLYKRNPQLFIEYNIQDCLLVEKMDQKLKFFDLIMSMSYEAKCNYQDTLGTVKIWDVYIHHYLLDQKKVLEPMRPNFLDQQIPGAYVKKPIVGLHKWVISFDASSLYPSIERQYNISPETFVKKIPLTVADILNDNFDKHQKTADKEDLTITANGCMFLRGPQGFIPQLNEKLYSRRRALQKELNRAEKKLEETHDKKWEYEVTRLSAIVQAIKIFLNSLYGALLNTAFRWFNRDYGEAITQTGQMTILHVQNHINKWLNKICKTDNVDYIVASDTDSLYIVLDRVVTQLTDGKEYTDEQILEIVNEFGETAIKKQIDIAMESLEKKTRIREKVISFDRECICNKAIWAATKQYILNMMDKKGVRYNPPKMKIVGLDIIKSSLPNLARKNLKKAVDIILNKDQEQLLDFVEEIKSDFFSREFSEIAFPRGCNNLAKYYDPITVAGKKCPIHTKAALYFNDYLYKNKLTNTVPLIKEGEKIKFIGLKMPNAFGAPVIANIDKLDNYTDIKKYIDYDSQFEKVFLAPLQNITKAINWQTERSTTYTLFD